MKKRCCRSGRATRKKRRKRVPRATISVEPQLVELATCPPDGFVKLRRMTFGELMTSQDMAYQVSMKASQDVNNPDMALDISRAKVTEYQFGTCIVDHNLEDDKGRKLSFKSAQDIHLLDSNIGQEIQASIDDIHNWNKQFPNSPESSENSSSVARSETTPRTPDAGSTELQPTSSEPSVSA